MTVIASFNRKGGVGKSTIIKILSKQLVSENQNVVIIDADGQTDLSMQLIQRSLSEEERKSLTSQGVKSPQIILGEKKHNNLWTYLSGIQMREKEEQKSNIKDHLLSIPLFEDKDKNNAFLLFGSYILTELNQQLHSAVFMSQMNPASSHILGLFPNLIKQIKESIPNCIILLNLPPNDDLLIQYLLLCCDKLFVPCLPDEGSLIGLELIQNFIQKWKTNFNPFMDIKLKNAYLILNQYQEENEQTKNILALWKSSKIDWIQFHEKICMVSYYPQLASNKNKKRKREQDLLFEPNNQLKSIV